MTTPGMDEILGVGRRLGYEPTADDIAEIERGAAEHVAAARMEAEALIEQLRADGLPDVIIRLVFSRIAGLLLPKLEALMLSTLALPDADDPEDAFMGILSEALVGMTGLVGGIARLAQDGTLGGG